MKRYRAIWISDVHLGTTECKADYLLDFLKNNTAETIYLVGDIIDGWALKNGGIGHKNIMMSFKSSFERLEKAQRLFIFLETMTNSAVNLSI